MAEKKTAAEAKVEKNDKKPAAKKPGVFKRIVTFVKGMYSELKKVTWPSGKDTMKNVGVVIACVLIVGVLITDTGTNKVSLKGYRILKEAPDAQSVKATKATEKIESKAVKIIDEE
jgi:preprotein translocase subunit SecE